MSSSLTHTFQGGEDGRCTFTWSSKLVCGQVLEHNWHEVDPQVDRACLPPLGSVPVSPEVLREVIEAVDHPKHYGGKDDPFEHVKVAEARGWGYHIGNATKYLWRMGKKVGADDLEDLEKARWYLDRFIQLVRQERNPANQAGKDGAWRYKDGKGGYGAHNERCSNPGEDHPICSWDI